MSSAVFPTLAGLTWDIIKKPEFSTITQRAVSGRELRIANMPYPLWTFTLKYELLRADTTNLELQKLLGFFLARYGSWDSFLFNDVSDNSITDQLFATGDGVTTQFQLLRNYGSSFTFIEPIKNVTAITNIKDNGVTVNPANYSVGSTGLVTFSVAPVSGHSLTCTCTFYYRVRFVSDDSEFTEFMRDLWENKEIKFTGSPANLV